MSKKITKERADEITAAWDAATDVQRLGMQRIQWLYVSGGNDETDYWEHEPPPLEKAAAARIAELEVQLSSMREERDLAVTVAEGCRVLMERPVTEDDIQAAIAEARRIRPEIEAENAIRKALES